MRDLALLVALALLAYLGLAALALAQRRNWSLVMSARPFVPAAVAPLRIAGGALLAMSLAIALLRDGPAFGPILWVVTLIVAGLLVVVTLTWRAKASETMR